MIVSDCSAILSFLLDPAENESVGVAVGNADCLAAPDLIDIELMSALRRLESLRRISTAGAERVIDDFLLLQLERFPSADLIAAIWSLRKYFSAYDAAYVALAQSLKVPLLTRDGRLKRAVTEQTTIVLI